MGRKPAAATTTASAATTEGAAVKPVVRRRRRRTTVDHVAQTGILIGALLKARDGAGTSQGDALAVVSWARGVHEEEAALRALATQARKLKAPGVAERQMAHTVNKALLDGVLAGTTTINVDSEGSIVFGDASAPKSAPEATE
jgi:hypothetical protein